MCWGLLTKGGVSQGAFAATQWAFVLVLVDFQESVLGWFLNAPFPPPSYRAVGQGRSGRSEPLSGLSRQDLWVPPASPCPGGLFSESFGLGSR